MDRDGVRPTLVARLLTLALFAAVWTGFGLAAEAASFLPHRAIYGLTLAKEKHAMGVTSARGKLEFEWKDVCDGWSVRQRTRIIVTHADGSEVDFGWKLNAWESKDGLRYRFFIRREYADGESEEVRGAARLDGPGEGGEATYELPAERSVRLPRGTIFPTQHSLVVLDALETESVPLWRVVFDGSGEEGLFGINAVMAQSLPPEAETSLESPLIDDQPSWRLLVAYFGMEAEATEPQYEQAMRIFANGVVDELLLDYGDFTLDASLADLTALPAPGC
ncbi:MAG: cell envelope integrity EipB family protein [Kiloniellales bacterium]|nr:cell envelope integrity EipB family protein [Kiloniellales bacterium]